MAKCLLCPNEYRTLLAPEDWQLLVSDGVEPFAICPSHEDIKKLAEIGNHTIRHARWDSQTNPKFRAVVIRRDGTIIPPDVPMFILVATDEFMAPTVRYYAQLKRGLSAVDADELLKIAEEAEATYAKITEHAKK